MKTEKPYAVLMIDPPWPQRKGGSRKVRPGQGRLLPYATLDMASIFALLDQQIFPMAAINHCVFVWTIDKFLQACEQQMEERLYKRHCRLIWDKEKGIAPAFTIRFAHEYLLWYYRYKLLPINREARGRLSSVIRETSRQHSRKPDAAYHLVEQLYPAEHKIDVFSREQRTGWNQFGNECDYFK